MDLGITSLFDDLLSGLFSSACVTTDKDQRATESPQPFSCSTTEPSVRSSDQHCFPFQTLCRSKTSRFISPTGTLFLKAGTSESTHPSPKKQSLSPEASHPFFQLNGAIDRDRIESLR